MESQVLVVEYDGERRRVEPGQELTFGRHADLVIDEANQYLHRVLGRFVHHQGRWWVENLGSQIELTVVAGDGPSTAVPVRATGAPRSAARLPSTPSGVTFAVADARYRIDVRVGPG